MSESGLRSITLSIKIMIWKLRRNRRWKFFYQIPKKYYNLYVITCVDKLVGYA